MLNFSLGQWPVTFAIAESGEPPPATQAGDAPGKQMQFDFKDVVARIAGVEARLHLFSTRLS
ncbi:MAG: hypothetical protein M3Y55_18870, partial [Pseudomonadota bacterium]|nr:hypothetical protein [Pseudomonadota bacterium]